MTIIDAGLIKKATGLELEMQRRNGIGLAHSDHATNLLTFLADAKYAEGVNSNKSIGAILVKAEDAPTLREGIEKIIVDDPVWTFFSVVDYLARNRSWEESRIDQNVQIHPMAFVSPVGVEIGAGSVIEARATVLPGVQIGRDTKICPGAVLGVDGYEHKKTSRGILSVAHDGGVFVGDRCEVGVNTFVAKGFSYRSTVIGDDSKLDALIHYAHAVQCGKRCMIVATAMVGGNVTIGDDVWIGPSASIANRLTLGDGAFVTMGSVVTKNVGAGEKVTGNFAIPHATFLKNLKKSVQ